MRWYIRHAEQFLFFQSFSFKTRQLNVRMYVRVTILILKSIKRQICFKSKKSILSTIDIKTDGLIRSDPYREYGRQI